MAVLTAILNKAFEDGKARDDAEWRRVRPFPKVDVPRIRFLAEDEAVRLVNSCSAEFRPLFRAALLTGARYGELVRMTVGNFNAATSQLFVAPSKSGKSRYIPFVNHGETEDEAAARTGANRATTIFVSWVTPSQAHAA